MIEFVGATYLEIVSLGGSLAAAHFLFHFFHGCLLGVIGDAGKVEVVLYLAQIASLLVERIGDAVSELGDVFSIKGAKVVDFATKGGKIGWFLTKPRGTINCQVNRDCIIQKK